ncbi:MAG: OmpH family outer membrane protein [Acidobacteria bacterium]|nr:OmpH family outer membrane protein [Acidobacteriota bacterium]
MKSICLAAALVLTSLSVHAQGTKIAIINSNQFSAETGGITKLVNAYKALDIEFKSTADDLQATNQKLIAVTNEINDLHKKISANPPNVKDLQAQYDQKVDEGNYLEISFKRKQEDAKAKYEKAEKIKTDPIIKEISDAIDAYAKARGYDMVLDGTKLDALMAYNPAMDVTDAFIKDFNAKSAGVPIKP